jgi:hypothetical protein
MAGELRKIRIAIVVLPVLPVTGLWLTRGEPWFPRLTGAGINVLMTAWLIHIRRKAKNARVPARTTGQLADYEKLAARREGEPGA